MEDKEQKHYIFLCCFFLAYISLFCYLGVYACPWKDDYAMLFEINKSGIIGNALNFYNGITGAGVPRLSSFIIEGIVRKAIPMETHYYMFPIITASTYFLALFFLISTLYPHIRLSKKFLSTLSLEAGTFTVLCALDQTFYSMFATHFFWSSSLMLLSFSIVSKNIRGGGVLTFSLSIAALFISGLSLETTAIFQVIITFCAVIYFLLTNDRNKTLKAGIFCFVSIIVFFILYLSPGVSKRILKMPFFPRIVRTIAVTIAFGFFTSLKFFIKPIIYVFLLFLPDIAQITPYDKNFSQHISIRHIIIAVVLIAALNQFVGGWAQGSGIEFRTESLALWMMGFVWVFMWTFCYRGRLSQPSKAKIYRFRWLLVIISLLVSSNFINVLHDLTIGKAYKAEHDVMLQETERQVSQGELDVYVPLTEISPRILNQAPWRPSPNVAWANAQFSRYHGLNSFSALPRTMLNDSEMMARWKKGDIQDFLNLAEGNEFLSFIAGEIYDWNFPGITGVPNDTAKAIYWYTKAAELGNVQACRRLTRIYVINDRSPYRYLKAGFWFVRSELPLLLP